MTPTRGLLLIISGPAGVGKTTITREVERRVEGLFSVSMTTRAKTHKDVEGRDYFFVDYDRFQEAVAQDELLEHAEVYPGKCYGTPRWFVEEHLSRGKVVIVEIDVQGAIQVKAKMPDALAMFILPPSEAVLLQRLRDRGREPEADIQVRFAKARKEINLARESGIYDQFIVNDDLATAIEDAVAVVRERQQADDGPTLFEA